MNFETARTQTEKTYLLALKFCNNQKNQEFVHVHPTDFINLLKKSVKTKETPGYISFRPEDLLKDIANELEQEYGSLVLCEKTEDGFGKFITFMHLTPETTITRQETA